MGIKEMQHYVTLCLMGSSSIPTRKMILADKKQALLAQLNQINESIAYIDAKQQYYDDVLSNKIEYTSNLD